MKKVVISLLVICLVGCGSTPKPPYTFYQTQQERVAVNKPYKNLEIAFYPAPIDANMWPAHILKRKDIKQIAELRTLAEQSTGQEDYFALAMQHSFDMSQQARLNMVVPLGAGLVGGLLGGLIAGAIVEGEIATYQANLNRINENLALIDMYKLMRHFGEIEKPQWASGYQFKRKSGSITLPQKSDDDTLYSNLTWKPNPYFEENRVVLCFMFTLLSQKTLHGERFKSRPAMVTLNVCPDVSASDSIHKAFGYWENNQAEMATKAVTQSMEIASSAFSYIIQRELTHALVDTGRGYQLTTEGLVAHVAKTKPSVLSSDYILKGPNGKLTAPAYVITYQIDN